MSKGNQLAGGGVVNFRKGPRKAHGLGEAFMCGVKVPLLELELPKVEMGRRAVGVQQEGLGKVGLGADRLVHLDIGPPRIDPRERAAQRQCGGRRSGEAGFTAGPWARLTLTTRIAVARLGGELELGQGTLKVTALGHQVTVKQEQLPLVTVMLSL